MAPLYSVLAALLPLTAAYVVDPDGARFHVDPVSGAVIDDRGRQRLFHGTNIVYKRFPFHPRRDVFDAQTSFVAEDMALAASLGFNSIRLNAPWAAVEPVEGQFNDTFLQTVNEIVEEAGRQHGIFSLLDHHQDAYSTAVCGTGFPSWTVADTKDRSVLGLLGKEAQFPAPLARSFAARGLAIEPDAPGDPNMSLCTKWNNNNWPKFHFAFQTALSYEEIYQNVKKKRTKFAQFWRHVAARFSASSFVLGYELMNEPFSGDLYHYPLNLFPGLADRNRFQLMYDELSRAIRAEDPHRLIMFQSVTWEVVLPVGERFGFDHVPGGKEFANRSVLSVHNSVLPNWTPDATYYKWRAQEAKRLGSAIMVTETGDDIQLKLANDFSVIAGWMIWDFKLFADWTWDNPGGFHRECKSTKLADCLDRDAVRAYARCYPMAVAGVLRSHAFDPTTAIGNFTFTPSESVTAPTVLFVPVDWHYPTGFNIDIQPAGAATWTSPAQNFVEIRAARGTVGDITVSVHPAADTVQLVV